MPPASVTRTCLGCGLAKPKSDLVRLVHDPGGRIVFDPAGRLPGRGAYICPSPSCLESGLKDAKLRRAFRRAVQSPPLEAAREALGDLLARKVMSLLGMAARSRVLVSGRDAVLRALGEGRASLLILAGDLSPNTANEILSKAGAVPGITIGTMAGIGAAIGAPDRGCLAVTSPPLAQTIRKVYNRACDIGLTI